MLLHRIGRVIEEKKAYEYFSTYQREQDKRKHAEQAK
jgi:hypothetical protein